MKYTVLCLLFVLPSLLAFRAGAPPEACSDLKPRHGVQPMPNDGFYLLGDVFNGTYTPGRTYQIQLIARRSDFAGFFIQARAENDQDSVTSIVGTWTPLDNTAKTVRCNGNDRDSVTHNGNDRKRERTLNWTAPSTDVGRIHFLYSVVKSFSNIIVKLNATNERPSDTFVPPPPPLADAVLFNSYGQPEGCQQNECDFFVEWRKNEDFIDFRMIGTAKGWIALGITADNSPLTMVNRSFVDVLACQTDQTRIQVNVKDVYLPGDGSTNLLFDNSTDGIIYYSGEANSGRVEISCSFTRAQVALDGQEDQDANFDQDNYIFFLSGNTTGDVDVVPGGAYAVTPFSSRPLNLNLGYVAFTDSFTSLPGKGSYPTNNCSREDCDFYFRWGVNPNNPNYLTIFISANLSQGWAAIGVSQDTRMGGDEIDDVFGCTTTDDQIFVVDTYNVAGGGRQNVEDASGEVGIITHTAGLVDGRLECTFSRVISVIPEEDGSDLNLDTPYYVLIGTGESPGVPFPRHQRTPNVSISGVNLVRETEVNFIITPSMETSSAFDSKCQYHIVTLFSIFLTATYYSIAEDFVIV